MAAKCYHVLSLDHTNMQIFNWMHSKLYPSVKYSHVSEKKDAFGGDERENMEISDGMIEEEALLLHDVLNGILAIGTLGRKGSFVPQSYCTEEDEIPVGDKMKVETDAEVKDKDNGAAPSLVASKPPVLIELDLKLPVEVEEKKMEMVVQDRETAEKIQVLPLLMEDKEKREQRVTLADLFAADASTMNDLDENPNKKMNARSKQYLIIHDKKLQNRKEAQSATTKGNAINPTRKLQKLITKLLKKKVHPEMEATTNVANMLTKKSRKTLMPGGAKSIE
ncbi:protein TILLER ANGLE CONTROL 1-like isoform X1 [Zingiber officinale]|uniref:protein TILLER ANGLE CONTROL 1-like isoform X1 n=1 Tax=Zingiber officinale TaxID=94328 RepID=UPI001C4D01DF|nr:protein TILLER ANGLE CONTROL 1-like isoform X1 [Zingiber officinale]